MLEVIKWMSIADRHTKMFLDKQMAHIGVNSSQYMYILRVCRQPGMTQDSFIKLFHIHPSNVTRAIAALEKEGFLERESNAGDKRTCRLFPTDKARAADREIEMICRQWQDRLLEGFNDEQRRRLEAMLMLAAQNAVHYALEEKGQEE